MPVKNKKTWFSDLYDADPGDGLKKSVLNVLNREILEAIKLTIKDLSIMIYPNKNYTNFILSVFDDFSEENKQFSFIEVMDDFINGFHIDTAEISKLQETAIAFRNELKNSLKRYAKLKKEYKKEQQNADKK